MTAQNNQPPKIGVKQVRLLSRLSNACAVSGDEGEVRKLVLSEVRPHADDIEIDTIGNVLVTCRGSKRNRLRVMLAAHMDEVGFMLTHNDGEGIYRFETVGGIDPRQMAGKPVWVGQNRVPGVIGVKPIHLSSLNERKQILKTDSLRIDLGPGGTSNVKVGDRACFATEFQRIGPSLRGKALDDRIGVATLIQLVQNAPSNIDLLAAFTVQEEIGLRGARIAAYKLDPDLAFALDCTPANDLPHWSGEENTRYNTKLGDGPAIYLADRATISDPRLIQHLVKTAEAMNIPYQFRQPGGGGTDAGIIHRQRGGIPSISLSVPGRYLHTAISIARLSDWRHTFTLLYGALTRLTKRILRTSIS